MKTIETLVPRPGYFRGYFAIMPMDEIQRAKVTRRTQRAQATKIWNKAQTLLEGDMDEIKVQRLQVILETYDAKIEQLRKIDETI